MEDDKDRHTNPIKAGWNLILEHILDENQESQLLPDNHQAIHMSVDELNKNLQNLSQYRHHLNCRLEVIKKEIEKLQLQAQIEEEESRRSSIEQEIMRYEHEGYGLQVELEGLELRLKKIRSSEKEI